MITSERLREILHYDPETGAFRWLARTNNRVCVGDVAGTISSNGYLAISADGRRYTAHRLAWLFQTGRWPERELDHINTDRMDNRWFNLREATVSQNQANARARTNCTSWFKGVNWDKKNKRWRSQLNVKGKAYFLGRFDTEHLAYAAYCIAAQKHFGEFARVYEPDQLIIPRKVFEERVLRNLLIATQPNYARAA